MPNYSSPSSTPWWKKVISNQWLMGALIGFVIGQVFFDLFGLLTDVLRPEEINIFWYKVMLIIVYWLTGMGVYKILRGKHWITKVLSVGLIWVGEIVGMGVVGISGLYLYIRVIAYIDEKLHINQRMFDVISESYMHTLNNLVMLSILIIGALLSESLIKLIYQLLKLPKQRLSNQQ